MSCGYSKITTLLTSSDYKLVRISGFFLILTAIAVFSAHLLEGIKTLRSLRKESITQKSSLISKEKVNKEVCWGRRKRDLGWGDKACAEKVHSLSHPRVQAMHVRTQMLVFRRV